MNFLLPKLLVLSSFVGARFYYSITVCGPAISPGQKWWRTCLKINISCSQWESSACIHEGSGRLGGVDRVLPIDPPRAPPLKRCFYWGVPNVPNKLMMCKYQMISILYIIFKKSSKWNQNPSKYCYNSITNLNFNASQNIIFQKSSYKNRLITYLGAKIP